MLWYLNLDQNSSCMNNSSITFVLFKILTNSFQMTNTIQKNFKVSSTQLLYQSCPYQAVTLLISGPFLDGFLTDQNVFAFKYTTQVLVRTKSFMTQPTFFPPICSYFGIITNTIHFLSITGFHHSILPNICICEFQHISCNWKDIPSHLSGSWTSEDMPGVGIWLCLTS